jgi:hypothetical protein
MDNASNKTEADFVYERYTHSDIGAEAAVNEDTDPVLVGDKYLAADIGLNMPAETPERNDLLKSDVFQAAETAGLTEGNIDDAEDQPLEDIPDADELHPGSVIDPAAPAVDAMPGTDVLNGTQGE